MKTDISIIVAVYNCQKYLAECVDSLLAQDLDDYEIILVDDESSDGSGAICDDYAARFEKVRAIHQKNSGPGGARNTGMDASTGKYIIFVDSDDIISKNCLGKIYRTAEENRLDMLVIARDTFADEDEETTQFMYKFSPSVGVDEVLSGVESLKRGLETDEYYPMVTFKLYRKEYLTENCIRFVPNVIHEDEGFSFVASIKAQRVMSLTDTFYHYRMHGASVMHTLVTEKRGDGFRTAIQQIGEVLEEVEGDWRNSPEAELVCGYIDRLTRYGLRNYMLADREDRLRSREKYDHWLDKSKRYYRGQSLKARLCAKDPYRTAPFYRVYRRMLLALKSLGILRKNGPKGGRAAKIDYDVTPLRKLYMRSMRIFLRNRNVSIISNNCISGFVSQDMGLPYRSPTVGLYIQLEDFLEFTSDLDYYLHCEPEEGSDDTVTFPVGILRRGESSVRLYFMHYGSFDEARSKWVRRAARVDPDDMCVIMEHPEPLSRETFERFRAIPCEHKRIITGETAFEDDLIVHSDIYGENYLPGRLVSFKDAFKRYLYDWDLISFLNSVKRR